MPAGGAARAITAAGGTIARLLGTGQRLSSAYYLNLESGEEGAEETAGILIEASDDGVVEAAGPLRRAKEVAARVLRRDFISFVKDAKLRRRRPSTATGFKAALPQPAPQWWSASELR